jgi:uncharacterized coiled-coil DUF342 family protein
VTNELESLRLRKVELEFRLNELQETRKDLMSELEELMKVLKVQGSTSNQAAKFGKISRNANLRWVESFILLNPKSINQYCK